MKYTCARCGGEFSYDEDDWTPDDALDEALDIFGADTLTEDGMGVVCEPCWLYMRQTNPEFDALCRKAGR